MLKIIEKDIVQALIDGDIDAVGHCANCQKTMKSGVAKALVDSFPEVKYADDLGGSPLGSFTCARLPGTQRVYNLYGQEFYGKQGDGNRYMSYEAMYTALNAMRNHVVASPGYTRVGFPHKMASDRAGGDWKIIETMISSLFDDTGIEVTIFKLPGT